METSKNIPLNGTLFITEKNKGKALPVIVIRTHHTDVEATVPVWQEFLQ